MDHLDHTEEVWLPIEDFEDYEVSNLGRIANVNSDMIVQQSRTLQGAMKVGLWDGEKQHTRSVKVIVAETYVEGRTHVFNTPVALDADQTNCVAHNLVWRPRWFAWSYTRQFVNPPEFYKLGPIIAMDREGAVEAAYLDTIEAAMTNGLLFEDIWRSIHTREGVFPTGQIFAFADKV